MSQSFEDLVRECRSKGLRRTIYNASREHAKVLFDYLLQEAAEKKEPIRLVSGDLKRDFYPDLADSLKMAIDANVDIQIVVLNPLSDLGGNDFAKKVLNYANGKVYKPAPDKANTYAGFPHFILIGNKKYRLETSHAHAKAVASFDNPSVGEVLENSFNALVTSGDMKQVQNI